MRGRRSVVWVTGVVVIDNMIHNLSIDSHIFVSDLNATTEMEEERGTHDMCAVCSLSSSLHRHHHHPHDQIMRMMMMTMTMIIIDDDQSNDDIINDDNDDDE